MTVAKNTEVSLCELRLGKDILAMVSKAQSIKEQINIPDFLKMETSGSLKDTVKKIRREAIE